MTGIARAEQTDKAGKENLLKSGNSIVFTKWLGMEGMVRIAEEKEESLKERFSAGFLKQIQSYRESIFAEKEKINGKTEYSKIPISLLEVGGSKKNVTFYLDVDQAEYLYEFAKSFGDCSYSSCKKNEAQKLKRTLLVRRQSFYNNQPKKYPWYLEIEVTKNEKKEKSCINMTDEGFFTFMNRIHRFIDCFVTAYSTNIMKMKFNNEQNWKQNKN